MAGYELALYLLVWLVAKLGEWFDVVSKELRSVGNDMVI
jgi:hypothetical protein